MWRTALIDEVINVLSKECVEQCFRFRLVAVEKRNWRGGLAGSSKHGNENSTGPWLWEYCSKPYLKATAILIFPAVVHGLFIFQLQTVSLFLKRFVNDQFQIGLTKLRLIRNGGIRVAENNKMCYSRYIDWKHLMAGPLNDILVDDAVEIGVGEGKISALFWLLFPCCSTFALLKGWSLRYCTFRTLCEVFI